MSRWVTKKMVNLKREEGRVVTDTRDPGEGTENPGCTLGKQKDEGRLGQGIRVASPLS